MFFLVFTALSSGQAGSDSVVTETNRLPDDGEIYPEAGPEPGLRGINLEILEIYDLDDLKLIEIVPKKQVCAICVDTGSKRICSSSFHGQSYWEKSWGCCGHKQGFSVGTRTC
jgi:hypothetical protein